MPIKITNVTFAGNVTPEDNPNFYVEVGGVFRRVTLGQLIDCIKDDIDVGGGLTDAAKQALLDCFEHVAWVDDQGQTYYDALHDALYPTPTSITAVFTQGGATIYDTQTLNDLRQYLVVTAAFDDGTEKAVSNYTLSGTLTAGISTITVTYQGLTTTFTVVVTHNAAFLTAVYTQSGTVYDTDSLNSLKSDLVVTYYADAQSSGVVVSSTDYTLSGTLTAGTSTITATYNGLTATFNVTVTAAQTHITAVYTQTGTVYDTDTLNVLKDDLVVTYFANPDASGVVVPSANYTLSGSLTTGTSTITATCNGDTDTFTVTVTEDIVASISAVYNQTYVVDYGSTLDSLKPDLSVTATYESGNVGIVTNYTQSGTLANDISTITVSLGGKTDTYDVICAPANRWNNNVLSIPGTDIVHGGFYNPYPYHNDSPNRGTYEGYWIDFDPRYKYTIQVLSENTFDVAVRQLTAEHFSAIKVSGDLVGPGDTGWQNNGYEFNSAGTVSSNVKMLWIPMRYPDNTNIDYSSITGMTVTRTLLT